MFGEDSFFISRNFIFALAFLCPFALVHGLMPLVFRVGTKLDLIDHPGHRKIHDKPIIRCGGMSIFFAIWLAVGIGLLVLFLFNNFEIDVRISRLLTINKKYGIAIDTLSGIFLCSSIVYITGFLDDKFSPRFSLRMKWILQMAATFLVVRFFHVRTHILPGREFDQFISFLWIIGLTNSFNLLDNMNGLCAGVAFICASFLLWVSIEQSQYYIALLTLIIMGALIGYLPYNFPRARVFLGDQGSLVIGFLLACLTLLESYISQKKTDIHFEVLMPLFAMALPLFDTASVIIIRLKQKRPLFVGDKSHLSHRLVDMGLTQVQAVVVLYVLTTVFAINAIVLVNADAFVGIMAMVQSLLMILILSFLMVYGKREDV
jgi:UDP-GlcNAc:undecaprenyl-phosphate GlcNAc-1-phosphate transferase